jgi:hypothetical protein
LYDFGGREAERILRGIANGLHGGRAADWGGFAGCIAERIGMGFGDASLAGSGTESAPSLAAKSSY